MAGQTLISWIGANDLKALENNESQGPLIATLEAQPFDRIVLLYNYDTQQVNPYLQLLRQRFDSELQAHHIRLSSPTHFADIYQAANSQLETLKAAREDISILLSPGTPAMQAIWILLGKTRYQATFYQSSREQGVERVDIPFEIAAEYIPPAKSISAKQLSALSEAAPPANAAFSDIITQSPVMQQLIARAQILAEHDVPVLIDGQSGTGKELFARAIHNASARKDKPFVAVNCGAFPSELIDSMLFGHKKGAFTGAVADKPGFFEQVNGGTLFLDEFGELTAEVQVRLLRVLQDKTFTRVGDTKEQTSDFRLVAATNKNLMLEITEGRFREDLFYRVAVGTIPLPPLKQREGDLLLLSNSLLALMGQEYPLLKSKKISASACNVIQQQNWPGNIRELKATLLRAALWAANDDIGADDIRQALFDTSAIGGSGSDILNRDLSQGLNLEALIGEVASHYIDRALAQTAGQKGKAAELLGFSSHQTLGNWQKKYGK